MDEFVASLALPDGIDEHDVAELIDAYQDQKRLIGIGRSLASERDQGRLIRLILEASMDITGADAGSVFLLEERPEGPWLRFAWTHTHSRDLPYEEFAMPADRASIAGYVALTGRTLNIPDAYAIDPAEPYSLNRAYDERYGYVTKSMLVVPMRDHKGRVLGVVQLINSKEAAGEDCQDAADRVILLDAADFRARVVPFKRRYEGLMEAVAAQAAIAIENGRMIARIREQFDALVMASVSTIEARDPATRGHSERVARMALALARAADAEESGPLAPLRFGTDALTELRYAALLHDFGKVLVDPRILLKAKKLHPRDYDYLRLRIRYLRRLVELADARRLARGMARVPGDGPTAAPSAARELLEAEELVALLVEPAPTPEGGAEGLARLKAFALPGELLSELDEEPPPLLTAEEEDNLAIARGSLNAEERRLVEAHATYTWDFVSKIPWPAELSGIPAIARDHHEALDGSGYPRGVSGPEIGMGARILAVCDIWDALSASDRPYKKALPREICARILTEEAERGRLDRELVRLFLAAGIADAAAPATPASAPVPA